MIYTTYFAKLKSLPKNIVPISICGKAPYWYKESNIKSLRQNMAFSWSGKKITTLDGLTLEGFLQGLSEALRFPPSENSEPPTDIALVCYEKPSDFCQRHLVAQWLVENGKCPVCHGGD